MAEGIPAAIVRFVQAAVHVDATPTSAPGQGLGKGPGQGLAPGPGQANDDAFASLRGGQGLGAGSGTTGTGLGRPPSTRPRPLHLLPRAAGVYLSQALYQLSSRVQNRGHLLAVGAPGTPLSSTDTITITHENSHTHMHKHINNQSHTHTTTPPYTHNHIM